MMGFLPGAGSRISACLYYDSTLMPSLQLKHLDRRLNNVLP